MAVPQQAHTDPMDWTVPVLLTGYFTMHPAANIYWVTAVELPPSTDTVNRSDGGKHSRETWCFTRMIAISELWDCGM